MGGMKVSELDFLRLLPAFMRDDEAVIALSKAVDQLMQTPGVRLSTIRIWDKIDELNEDECDELAWELGIDWYDSSASIEEKREAVKSAQMIKRKHGTKWAVQRLVSIYFENGEISEWFEYGGEPHHFRIVCDDPSFIKKFSGFMQMLNIAKRCSAWLDDVTLRMSSELPLYYGMVVQNSTREYYRLGV